MRDAQSLRVRRHYQMTAPSAKGISRVSALPLTQLHDSHGLSYWMEAHMMLSWGC